MKSWQSVVLCGCMGLLMYFGVQILIIASIHIQFWGANLYGGCASFSVEQRIGYNCFLFQPIWRHYGAVILGQDVTYAFTDGGQ